MRKRREIRRERTVKRERTTRERRVKNNDRKIFGTKFLFLLFFFLFMIIVIFRFVAIKRMDSGNDAEYVYQFDYPILGEFYIEGNKTVLKNSSNIDVDQSFIGKEKTVLPPYAFFTLNFGENRRAVYQLIPDKKRYALSLFTRPKWFEVIGGDYESRDGDSIVSLKKGDSPILMVMNVNPKKSLYRAEGLRVVALKKGYYYQGIDGKKIEIPYYGGSLSRVRSWRVWNSLESVDITKAGYITNQEGKDIIKIYLGTKNQSVLISKKTKKYGLLKRRTINISIVDNNVPSSKVKLVYADKELYKKRLSYNYVRIAHLLITYGISNPKESIEKNIESSNFLKRELSELAEDFDEGSGYYREYVEKLNNMKVDEVRKLSGELLRYVEEGDYYRTKQLILMGADVNRKNPEGLDMLSMVLAHQKNYLTVPQEMKFKDNRLIIKGNEDTFGSKYYIKPSHFATTVPILDKPQIPQKEHLKINELNQFLNVTDMSGLFVSDEKAEIFYSKTPKSFIRKADINYRKAPPLFLFNTEKTGKYVAPEETIKGKFYYKIKSNKRRVYVAFNGKIKQNGRIISSRYNAITPFAKTYPINIRNGEAIIEVTMNDRPMECGVIFESDKKITSLSYSYGWRNFKKFEIINRGDRYQYRLQKDSSKPFKEYTLLVKANRNVTVKYLGDGQRRTVGRKARSFKYSPSLACLAKSQKSEFLSFYDKDNLMELVPKSYIEKGMRPKRVEKRVTEIIEDENRTDKIISNKLLPIYGDGVHYGLTSKGIKVEDLTLDIEFTKKVADIFEEVIAPLKTPQAKKTREKYNTILEGASVVLEDNGDGKLDVVAMYSYPYPSDLNLKDEESYNRELFKYMLLDEFKNSQSSLRNRVLDMGIRPGSTFKIVTSIAGFKANLINILDTKYRRYLEGTQDIYGVPFKNGTTVGIRLKNFSFSNGYTEPTKGATFKSSFKYSYNVYFGYLALLLNHKLDKGFKKDLYPISNDRKVKEEEFSLLKVANELQFNSPIYLSKKKNIFAYPSIFPNNFVLSKEVADSGIGQFEVAATPMQMAVVVNTVRSRNIVIPRILKKEKSQTIVKNYISKETQKEIQEAMGLVVSDKDGTAKCAFYHNRLSEYARKINRNRRPENRVGIPCISYRNKFKKVNPTDLNGTISVYGKTGTAEKGKGKLYDGWFVSYAKDKRGKHKDIVVVTIVRNSGTGGTYSATINKKIIEAWYAVKKDEKE